MELFQNNEIDKSNNSSSESIDDLSDDDKFFNIKPKSKSNALIKKYINSNLVKSENDKYDTKIEPIHSISGVNEAINSNNSANSPNNKEIFFARYNHNFFKYLFYCCIYYGVYPCCFFADIIYC